MLCITRFIYAFAINDSTNGFKNTFFLNYTKHVKKNLFKSKMPFCFFHYCRTDKLEYIEKKSIFFIKQPSNYVKLLQSFRLSGDAFRTILYKTHSYTHSYCHLNHKSNDLLSQTNTFYFFDIP